jgi:hypothetical protein
MDQFDANKDGKVTWTEFRDALVVMKDNANNKAKQAKEYSSYTQMKDDKFKHKRMNVDLQQKYKVPLTFNQSVGFRHADEISKDISKQVRRPINKCHETKYAEAMIKTGVHFS